MLIRAQLARRRLEGLLRTRNAADARGGTRVDVYWGRHTVNAKPFSSAHESEAYLDWRFSEYPLFREFMSLYRDHDEEDILDYGCGPGDDVVGYLTRSKVHHVTGVDVSAKALELAERRLSIHKVDPTRVTLLKTEDSASELPLLTSSIDHINCGGGLHHTSQPTSILREIFRVLTPGGTLNVMVYNRESIWYHRYTA